MTTGSSSYHIPNVNDPSKPFTFINIQNTIKLTSTNYLSWKMQIEAILIGHDLHQYVNGSLACPPTVTTTDGIEGPNPAFLFWTRQDKLLFGALVGTLSQSLIPLVSQANTSKDLWDILAKTYALPSRGHIKQLKEQLHRITKGSRSITEFMQAIKSCADQLAALGKKVEHEDLIDRVLIGLDASYNSVVDAVNARDTPISFEELHEKLINKELSLQQHSSESLLPACAFAAAPQPPPHGRPPYARSGSSGILPTPTGRTSKHPPRAFLGKCQWCREQGHVVTQCPVFTKKFPNVTPPTPPPFSNNKHHPQANMANVSSSTPTSWLLDSGASHHVTTDLNNLALHSPYDGTEELIIGDGTGLKITHIGSLSFPYLSSNIKLNNVLHVPSISRNIISISQLCNDNNASIEFLPHSFILKDLTTGASLFQGPVKSGVYEIQFTPPQVFASTKVESLDWHHRLGHPSQKSV